MIITAVIGLSVLMIMMFIGIKYYVNKNDNSALKVSNEINKKEPKVEYSSNSIALVRSLTSNELVAFDTEAKTQITRPINQSTKFSDAYGNAIPLHTIKPGDLVELVFQPDREKILAINKTSKTWEKPRLDSIKMDVTKRQIEIAKTIYQFTDDTLFFNTEGRSISANLIGEYDVLTLQGIADTVWSVKVLEQTAQIALIDLPSVEGRIEINRSRMIALKDLAGPIQITPGTHKLVIDITGYESVVQDITLDSGEYREISLKDAKEAFASLNIHVTNQIENYIIKVGDNTFNKGDVISVKQGEYQVLVEATGYKPWTRTLKLDGSNDYLTITLEQEVEQTQQPEQTQPVQSNPVYAINISTEPAGAYVYIGGVYKGQTPFTTSVPVGDYDILLEKAGYQNYYTSIIIDNSDSRNNFLYVLTPE